jgi:membrane fusion protein (multidrug efflux system)
MRSIALFILVSVLAGCRGGAGKGRTRPPPAVTTAQVQVRDVPVEVRAPVDLRAIAQAEVSAKTLGYIDAVLVDRGDRVKKGQLLALVRPSDLPDQLAAARGALAQAQAAAALARANKERAEQLAPSGVVSTQDLQAAVSGSAAADAALAAAQANVAALAVRLGETRVESPLDGVVTQRRLDPGALVGPTAGTGSILSVERQDVLRVFVPVNERDVGGLQVGQDAHVELDAFPGRSYAGKVVRISAAFDPVTRTLDAEVQLKNPGELLSGMYGHGSIVKTIHRNAVVAPATATEISNDRSYVFVLREDKVKRVEVQTGVDGGTWLEILSGLQPGDEIVTAGADVLSDGSTVRAQRDVNPFTGGPAISSTKPESGR